ncbi:hypothetical protein LguiB_026363 [Lonicera macranthoides]
MDSDSWTCLSTSPRRYQSRSDAFHLGKEFDSDDESTPEYLCPFCAEDFDTVELCCHIDEEHPVEGKNGVCPVCAKRVGMNLVGHITMQHGNLLKVQRRRRFCKGGSNSALSILRKELKEGNFQSFLGGSSSLVSSSNTELDPWLSSFIFSPPVVYDEPTSVKLYSSNETSVATESSVQDLSEREIQQTPALSDKDQEEKAQKCEFVQGLLLSTFLNDDGL